MLTKETLTLITKALGGESGEDNKEAIAELAKDQGDYKEMADKVVTLESSLKDVEGLDISKLKTMQDMLNENSISSTEDLINLVKKGEASEADKSEWAKKETQYKQEIETTKQQTETALLKRDVIDTIAEKYAFGNRGVAEGLVLRAGIDNFSRSDNGEILGTDKNGGKYEIASTQYAEHFNAVYGNDIPKPLTGSGLDHSKKSTNNDGGKSVSFDTIAADIMAGN